MRGVINYAANAPHPDRPAFLLARGVALSRPGGRLLRRRAADRIRQYRDPPADRLGCAQPAEPGRLPASPGLGQLPHQPGQLPDRDVPGRPGDLAAGRLLRLAAGGQGRTGPRTALLPASHRAVGRLPRQYLRRLTGLPDHQADGQLHPDRGHHDLPDAPVDLGARRHRRDYGLQGQPLRGAAGRALDRLHGDGGGGVRPGAADRRSARGGGERADRQPRRRHHQRHGDQELRPRAARTRPLRRGHRTHPRHAAAALPRPHQADGLLRRNHQRHLGGLAGGGDLQRGGLGRRRRRGVPDRELHRISGPAAVHLQQQQPADVQPRLR